MRRLILVISAITIFINNSNSQDLIIRKNGKDVECQVIKEDSLNVYVKINLDGRKVDTYIRKNDISQIIYSKNARLSSQDDTDSIYAERNGIGYKYYLNGDLLTQNGLSNVLKQNQEAYNKYQKAKGNVLVSQILAYAGGFMIGYPIGTALGGGEPNWQLAGVGVGCLVVMIPIAHSAENQVKQAVDFYNNGVKRTTMRKYELKIGIMNNGLRLCMNF